ncbi:hypothetical protein [Undibacterium sp. Ji49W]|uniref:hypothetical protein n=1 Tax=Undibacterium sp. Ji49W TaxID=3413040 RepID=UPI003BEFE951
MNDRITFLDTMLFLLLLLTSPIWLACIVLALTLSAFCKLLAALKLPQPDVGYDIYLMGGIGLPFFLVWRAAATGFLHLTRARPQIDETGFSYLRWYKERKIAWTDIEFIKSIGGSSLGSEYQFALNDGTVITMNAFVKIQYLLDVAKSAGVSFYPYDRKNNSTKRDKAWDAIL